MYIRWMTPRRLCAKLSSAWLNVSDSVGGGSAAGFGSSVWIELKSCCLCLTVMVWVFQLVRLLNVPAQMPSAGSLAAVSEVSFHSLDTNKCFWETKYDKILMGLMQNYFKGNFNWLLKIYFVFLSLQSLQMLPQQRKAIAKFKEPAHALAFQQKFHR